MLEYFLLVLGLIALTKGADFLIDGASALAKKFGVSTLVIGLTIVAFGTSMPELIVNIFASLGNNGSIAFGNIVGSNIANILLILGVCSLIAPMTIQKSTVWKEIPIAFLAVVLLFIFASRNLVDGVENTALLRTDGMILLLFFLIFLGYVFIMAFNDQKKSKKNKDETVIKQLSNLKISLYILGGLLGLYLGGQWVVNSAITIARNLGISELLIGSTIVAVGTSLPELITSIKAAMKKDADMAIGNVVGSNIFNVLFILGTTALINPIVYPAGIIVDIILVIIVTFVLFLFIFIGKKYHLTKLEGAAFFIMYLIYLGIIILRG